MTSSMIIYGKSLLQFPRKALVHWQLWIRDDLETGFDAPTLFNRLIHSHAYQHDQFRSSSDGTHGPFAVASIRPDHYEPLSAEAAEQALYARLIPASAEKLAPYQNSWPSIEELQRRLAAVLTYINATRLRWYRLAIELEEESYWSETYREVPIFDHFEEWIGVDPKTAIIHMLQVIRD